MLCVEDLRTLRKARKYNGEVGDLLLTYENQNTSTVRVPEVPCIVEENTNGVAGRTAKTGEKISDETVPRSRRFPTLHA
jgi:hypothetical protein